MIWLDTLIQGILLGGLYALFATGLSLIFGIMRLVNLAHGDLMVVAAFAVLVIVNAFGLNIFISALIAAPIMFALGYWLQYAILNRTLGKDILPPLLVTFGLSIILQNGMLEAGGIISVTRNSALRRGWQRLAHNLDLPLRGWQKSRTSLCCFVYRRVVEEFGA